MTVSRPLLALAAFGICAASPVPAQHAHLGFHAGFNLDRDDALAGAQLLVPLGGRAELYPSFDYYFSDAGSLVGLNLDLKFRAVAGWSALYLGGGLNFLRGSDGARGTGANLFAGLESRAGAAHPYLEFRVLLHDNTSSQLLGGINWPLF